MNDRRKSLEILLARDHHMSGEVRNLADGIAAFGRAAGVPAELYSMALRRALRTVDAQWVAPAPTRPVEPRPAPDAPLAAPGAEDAPTGAEEVPPVALVWYDRTGRKRAEVRFNIAAWVWEANGGAGHILDASKPELRYFATKGRTSSLASAVCTVVDALEHEANTMVVVPEWASNCGGALQLCRVLLRNALERDDSKDELGSFLRARALLDEMCRE